MTVKFLIFKKIKEIPNQIFLGVCDKGGVHLLKFFFLYTPPLQSDIGHFVISNLIII